MRVKLDKVHAAPWGSELLRNIDFTLESGEILGVLGPNGAGKTTLLNLLCGAVPPSHGSIALGGRPPADWSIRELARSIAVLPQQSYLNFPYTVEEVVGLGRTPHASGAATDGRIVDEALAACDATDLRHRLYTQLSGGEKQRVQLARVFAQIWRGEDSESRLLLLDEPTSALDLPHQKQVMESVQRMAGDGCSAVIILHDFNLAARYTHHCLVLDDGAQYACGPARDVLAPAMFEAVFGVEADVIEHPRNGLPVVIAS